MPFKYIGRRHDFKGKTLWEIIGNLKNFGVGRLIARSVYERYPEPTYFKILTVEPYPNPIKPTYDDVRKVRVTVENTFRGHTQAEPFIIDYVSYKTDYRLIPKDEEETYIKRSNIKPFERKILPKYMELPPLLKEVLTREMKGKGENPDDLKLEIIYNPSAAKHKIAEEGETPTEQFTVGLGKTAYADTLYKGIKLE